MAHKGGQPLAKASLRTHLGKPTLQRLINFVLHYIADLDIPVKRGTFIEFRNGMLNVSPIGRNCSQEERDEFERYDAGAGVRCGLTKAHADVASCPLAECSRCRCSVMACVLRNEEIRD